MHLVHAALPVADLDRIDLSVEFLGRRLRAPLVIASMTGGHGAATEVNKRLAAAAQRHGLAMGVGSQRAALREPRLAASYSVARKAAPDAFLIGNLGAGQLVPQGAASEPAVGAAELQRAVEMIRADALAIHLNFLEEAVMPEGDRRVDGLRQALAAAVESAPVPLIAKETGAGLARAAALELRALGFGALDVGGLGGTSFAAVEGERAAEQGDQRGRRMGAMFRDWGVPTAISVVAAAGAGLPLIATGGIRSGLDAAKALALGATAVGVARPLLTAALESEEAVDAWIAQFLEELRVSCFLSGVARAADLGSAAHVISGETRRWLDDLGWAG